jgi:hypothetical protein
MDIKVEYDGEYPNLCRGHLVVIVDGVRYDFGTWRLSSGGDISNDFTEVNEGPWSIDDWPDNFPEEFRKAALEEINSSIRHGCCGGCI